MRQRSIGACTVSFPLLLYVALAVLALWLSTSLSLKRNDNVFRVVHVWNDHHSPDTEGCLPGAHRLVLRNGLREKLRSET